ncbi:hypothetical protein BpHYR1_046265 [Brachionus plicatilis]|uniref:Uncharacterized protein n=1 Tax=Brachionus plicatilis TaxID=10195 RepID=A0A3M7S5H3_BRAPC|nr:hypothetical protein BpHYR1_046265 [Brachionus plicatilis]
MTCFNINLSNLIQVSVIKIKIIGQALNPRLNRNKILNASKFTNNYSKLGYFKSEWQITSLSTLIIKK